MEEQALAILAKIAECVAHLHAHGEHELIRRHMRIALDRGTCCERRRSEIGPGRECALDSRDRNRRDFSRNGRRGYPAGDGGELRVERFDSRRHLHRPGEWSGAGAIRGQISGKRYRLLRRWIDQRKPRRIENPRLRRNPARSQLDRIQRGAQIDPPIAEMLIPSRLRRIGNADAGCVFGQDVLGRHRQELFHLVGRKLAADPRCERVATRHNQSRGACRLPGRKRSRAGHHADVIMATILRYVRIAEVGRDGKFGRESKQRIAERHAGRRRQREPRLHIGHDASNVDRVVVIGRIVVVRGVEVG